MPICRTRNAAITAERKVGRWGGKARTGALKEAVEQIGAREREKTAVE